MIAYNVLEMRAPWPTLQGDAAARRAIAGERPPISRSLDRRISALMVRVGFPARATTMLPPITHILLKALYAQKYILLRPLLIVRVLEG